MTPCILVTHPAYQPFLLKQPFLLEQPCVRSADEPVRLPEILTISQELPIIQLGCQTWLSIKQVRMPNISEIFNRLPACYHRLAACYHRLAADCHRLALPEK